MLNNTGSFNLNYKYSIYLVLEFEPVLLYKLYNGELQNSPITCLEDDET